MKSIRKDVVVELNSIKNIHVEKRILLQVNHPFLISMEYVFVKSTRIYFIMDYIRYANLFRSQLSRGGELLKHISEAKRFTEERARFYAAQIAIALGYLHNSKVIYRDLKPENVLLGADGYIMMADFGLSRIRKDEEDPNSFCGTPEYLGKKL